MFHARKSLPERKRQGLQRTVGELLKGHEAFVTTLCLVLCAHYPAPPPRISMLFLCTAFPLSHPNSCISQPRNLHLEENRDWENSTLICPFLYLIPTESIVCWTPGKKNDKKTQIQVTIRKMK
jgi:hypothetical protein